MARRRREIGNDQFIKLDEFESGETIFSEATYLGTGEGMHGTFYRFEQDGEVFCIGSTALGMKLENFLEGDKLELEYAGKKPSKHKGRKPFHDFKMWELEDDDDAPEPTPVKAVKKPAKPADVEPEDEDEADEPLPPAAKRKPSRSAKPQVATTKRASKTAPKAMDEDLAALDDLE